MASNEEKQLKIEVDVSAIELAEEAMGRLDKLLEQTQRRAAALGRISAAPFILLERRATTALDRIERSLMRLNRTRVYPTVTLIDQVTAGVEQIHASMLSLTANPWRLAVEGVKWDEVVGDTETTFKDMGASAGEQFFESFLSAFDEGKLADKISKGLEGIQVAAKDDGDKEGFNLGKELISVGRDILVGAVSNLISDAVGSWAKKKFGKLFGGGSGSSSNSSNSKKTDSKTNSNSKKTDSKKNSNSKKTDSKKNSSPKKNAEKSPTGSSRKGTSISERFEKATTGAKKWITEKTDFSKPIKNVKKWAGESKVLKPFTEKGGVKKFFSKGGGLSEIWDSLKKPKNNSFLAMGGMGGLGGSAKLLKTAGKFAGPVGRIMDGVTIMTAKPGEERYKAVGGVAGAALLGGVGTALGTPLLGAALSVVGGYAGEKVGGWIYNLKNKKKESLATKAPESVLEDQSKAPFASVTTRSSNRNSPVQITLSPGTVNLTVQKEEINYDQIANVSARKIANEIRLAMQNVQ
ncbi:hypothetical protein J41TS12_07130 [Paenibacillus antibioticophila]|uniref:Uncharacterized protein n=1 Tax=Paenibacillus antibioticophila TaxID=1274374 RepID=A0A919XMQ5_9BACL|nr:hypothetical protein [Paenibacillus antibioticophila]GIO35852.1 hypothetical protein J41TS12_07130 [Paenibacillus antibioticophila]